MHVSCATPKIMAMLKLLGFCAATALLANACADTIEQPDAEAAPILTGEYLGQTPPGLVPQLFAEGVISTALHDDGAPSFSPDGREVYFRKWAVPHDVMGFMRRDADRWTAPTLFREFGRYIVSVPIYKTDGTGAYFLSRRPLDGIGEPADYNVWYADKETAGWGELTALGPALNTPGNEFPHSISASGTLYLQGNYDDALGDYDIYTSRLIDGSYEAPQNLGAPVNTEFTEAAPSVAPDESFIVYTAAGGRESYGSTDLYVTFRSDDGAWTPGINLGLEVNSTVEDKFSALSPDGRYLFFVSHRNADRSYVFSDLTYDELMARNQGPTNGQGSVYWVSTEVIDRVRPR